MASERLAANKKNARRQHAHIVFIDESGLMMAPLLRRTWAPIGHPPVLRQEGGHRQKVSVAAAIWISPCRRRLGLLYQTLENKYFNNVRSVEFVKKILRRLPGNVIIVWDGGSMHKGDPIRALESRYAKRLTLERLPPYAPMLNPVEPVWNWLKWGRLCNFAPFNAHQLNRRIVARLNVICRNQKRLRAFFRTSELPLPRALLS